MAQVEDESLEDLFSVLKENNYGGGEHNVGVGGGIKKADLDTCCRVLRALGSEPAVFASPQFKELRMLLQPLNKMEEKRRYAGKSKSDIDKHKQQLRDNNRFHQQAKAYDKHFINNTKLRAGRIAKLEALKAEQGSDTRLDLLVPDGIPSSSSLLTLHNAPGTHSDQPRLTAPTTLDPDAADTNNQTASQTLLSPPPPGSTSPSDASTGASAVEGESEEADGAREEAETASVSAGDGGSSRASEGQEAEAERVRLNFHRDAPKIEQYCADTRRTLERAVLTGGYGGTSACYICKRRYVELHFFYDQLCPSCASLNYTKRRQAANLRGKIAIVTGARVKIGFRVCLKLLRCGATVIATTRFPMDALERLRAEPDFADFQDRLHVVGLDLRDVAGVEAFCALIAPRFGKLHILVNNACQTIRRPTAYYAPQVRREASLIKDAPPDHTPQLALHATFEASLPSFPPTALPPPRPAAAPTPRLIQPPHVSGSRDQGRGEGREEKVLGDGGGGGGQEGGGVMERGGGGEGGGGGGGMRGVSRSALWSQVGLVAEEDTLPVGAQALPAGLVDVNGSQLDLRTSNSWLLTLEHVSTPELIEVMSINAIAPFTLCAKLQPLLERSFPPAHAQPHDQRSEQEGGVVVRGEGGEAGGEGGEGGPEGGWSHVVNVSAMEGKFYRHKTPNHPHTNMAKAALNMLTRTTAADLRTKGILVNAVDTGWINDENPVSKAASHAQTTNFQTPIDEEDAAARILDPVMRGARGEAPLSGLFLKDYFPTEW